MAVIIDQTHSSFLRKKSCCVHLNIYSTVRVDRGFILNLLCRIREVQIFQFQGLKTFHQPRSGCVNCLEQLRDLNPCHQVKYMTSWMTSPRLIFSLKYRKLDKRLELTPTIEIAQQLLNPCTLCLIHPGIYAIQLHVCCYVRSGSVRPVTSHPRPSDFKVCGGITTAHNLYVSNAFNRSLVILYYPLC